MNLSNKTKDTATESSALSKSKKGVSANSVSNNKTSLEMRFLESQSDLSKSRKALLKKILSEPKETFFLSSREMAKRYGVDSSTIVRTVQAMGYDKFAEFADDLRNHFVMQITPYTAMKAATKKKGKVVDHIHRSIEQDLQNLNALKNGIDAAKVERLAKTIHKAGRIVVIGIDFAESLAISLAYGLVGLGYDAEAPVGSTGVVQNKVRIMNEKDLLIAFSFGQGLRETINAIQRARRKNVPTFGITDSGSSPTARFSEDHLIASIARTSFLDSYVAPVAAINAILVACAHSQAKRSLELLARVEEEDRESGRWYKDNA